MISVMVCGLPASGKSTIVRAPAEVFNISVIRSDVIRKKLFVSSSGLYDESAFKQGLYSAYATEVTYKRMFDPAQGDLKNRFEPIARIGDEIHITVDTGTPPVPRLSRNC